MSMPEIPGHATPKEMKRFGNSGLLGRYGIINVKPFGGPDSTTLLDSIEFTRHKGTKEGAVNGIKLGTEKVMFININTGEGRFANTEAKSATRQLKQSVKRFKELLENARKEYEDSSQNLIDEQAGSFVGPEATEELLNITERTVDDVEERLQEDVDEVVEQLNAGGKEDMARQISTALSPDEITKDNLELTGDNRKTFIEAKLKGLVGPKVSDQESSEKENFLDKAKEEKKKADEITETLKQPGTDEQTTALEKQKQEHLNNELLYKKLAEMYDLKADE